VSAPGYGQWATVAKRVNSTANCTVRWQVYANDSWGGLWNATDVFTYRTTLEADLRVGKITVNNSNPSEGEFVLIRANVSNYGPSDANSSRVWFNSTDGNGVVSALGERTVDIAAGGWTWENVTASFGQGTHTINVSARTSTSVVGLSPANDDNTTQLSVPVWAYMHGNATGTLMLAIGGETDVFEWTPEELQGNVFFMDVDSGVDFTNMKPLNGSGDLHELDVALGIENFTGDVNQTYDSNGDGVADQTTTFDVYGDTLAGVPVVNASDGSPWLVGIIWDGDDGPEYTGAEDVVFIVKIKPGTNGAFGVNDYEAKVPSNLKSLKGSLDLIATRLGVE
jgi:hypothetical protein